MLDFDVNLAGSFDGFLLQGELGSLDAVEDLPDAVKDPLGQVLLERNVGVDELSRFVVEPVHFCVAFA